MAGKVRRGMVRKPSFLKMLVKYDEDFTGKFNWISLAVLAVLVFDIPVARALDAGDFAWFFALVFVAALLLGVPFALYITYMDYRLALECYSETLRGKLCQRSIPNQTTY